MVSLSILSRFEAPASRGSLETRTLSDGRGVTGMPRMTSRVASMAWGWTARHRRVRRPVPLINAGEKQIVDRDPRKEQERIGVFVGSGNGHL